MITAYEDEKQKTLQKLSDMFPDIEGHGLRELCEKLNWNVDLCIDYLLNKQTIKQNEIQRNGVVRKNISSPTEILQPHSSLNMRGMTTETNSSFNSYTESEIVQLVRARYKVMVIMRGASGSGKTYLANNLLKSCIPQGEQYFAKDYVLSADDYFYDSFGRYFYNYSRLDEAHLFNQRRVQEKAKAGLSPIIVDNTNMKLWEMKPYVKAALTYGYTVRILEPKTPWCHSAGKLATKNQHRVPREKIRIMLNNYEAGNVEDLLKMVDTSKCKDFTVPHSNLPVVDVTASEPKLQILTNRKEYGTNAPKPQRINNRISAAEPNRSTEFCANGAEGTEEMFDSQINPTTEETKENLNLGRNETSIFNLLMEGVSKKQVEARSPNVLEDISQSKKIERHDVGCINEDQTFAWLRQMYSNKPIAALWDLFVKCNGDIHWVIDILLKENDFLSCEDSDAADLSFCSTKQDAFRCNCNNNEKSSTTVDVQIEAVAKPQRQRTRFQRPIQRLTGEMRDIKESIENRIVLKDDYHSKLANKIRDSRKHVVSKNEFLDIGIQTEAVADEQEDETSSELLEIHLGEGFISQLESIFADELPPIHKLSKHLNKNIFIPRNLAKELFMLWVESANNQIEEHQQETLHNDADFARLLKNPKYENYMQSPSNVQELLDLEMALKIQSEEQVCAVDKRSEPALDLASHLTQMKLSETFPNIPKETLLEVFSAHGHKYDETLRVLQGNTNAEKHAPSATNIPTMQIALPLQQQNRDKLNANNSLSEERDISLDPDKAKKCALRMFEEARNSAAHHSQIKAECYQKSKDAIQANNYAATLYYSQVASFHRAKIEFYNHRAANYIMEVHKYDLKNAELLDLHYLHVLEAISCLDVFLDRHITALRNSSRSYKLVYVITGRGLHSTGGVSTIKSKVKGRLKDRNLRWTEANPGLLKIKLFSASRFSDDI